MKEKIRPVIGITCSMASGAIKLGRNYFNAIWAAGGLPVGLPYSGTAEAARQYFASGEFDGILFSGGVDVDPHRYGEEITGDNVEISAERDEFELTLAELVKPTDLPVLGICRGIQLLNVAFGGTLYQDIPSHRQSESGDTHERHANVTSGTLLRELVGRDHIFTNSFHHQAVKDPAPGFIVAARSDDGTIEAIEPAARSERFILGVQWHPEIYHAIDDTSMNIFRTFVEAAKK